MKTKVTTTISEPKLHHPQINSITYLWQAVECKKNNCSLCDDGSFFSTPNSTSCANKESFSLTLYLRCMATDGHLFTSKLVVTHGNKPNLIQINVYPNQYNLISLTNQILNKMVLTYWCIGIRPNIITCVQLRIFDTSAKKIIKIATVDTQAPNTMGVQHMHVLYIHLYIHVCNLMILWSMDVSSYSLGKFQICSCGWQPLSLPHQGSCCEPNG